MKRVLAGLRARLRGVLRRADADRDMDEELRFHLEMETEKNVRAGMDPDEARRRAHLAFGGVERHRQRLREGRRVPVLEPLWNDVRFGLRSIARDPGLSAVAALTIALGIGATTTVFSAVNTILIRPLPVPGADRVASIQEQRSGTVSTGLEGMLIPYPRIQEYRDGAADIFQDVAGLRLVDNFALRLPDETVAVNGALTSGNYFQTLGVRPEMGRAYDNDDAAEIVISHDLWISRFAGDPGVVGRTVGVDGRTVTVVGVAPAGFAGTTFVANRMWVPVGVRGVAPESWSVQMVPLGRLRDGVGMAQANAAIDALSKRLPADGRSTVRGARVDPVAMVPADARGAVTGFFGMMLGAAVFVLLIAAANIAAVMVARGVARRREMAVRLALGAGRARVVRHLLAESLLLFSVGGVLGIALAHLGVRWLSGIELPPQVPPLLLGFSLDGRVLAFAVAVTGSTGLVFGLVPALGSSRPDLVPALKTGTAGSMGGRSRARDLFVAGQVALAVTLLLAATLFARSLMTGLRSDVGFRPDGVIAATVDLGAPHEYSTEEGRTFQRDLLARVRSLPGVESASLSEYVLLSGSRSGGQVRRSDAPDQPPAVASYDVVTPDFFQTLGIGIEEGRGFRDTDTEGSPPVVVINRTLADRLWPGQNPIGGMLAGFTREPAQVVGVTGPGKYVFITEEPRGFVYLPYLQIYRPQMNLHVRAPGREAATMRAVGDVVRSLDPDVALGSPMPVRAMVGMGLMPQRFAAQLVGAFGVVGLILAAMGIYGVLAYQVARRTRELGVRRALGATSRSVVGAVLGRGAALAAAGCVLGTAVGGAVALVARSFLFGIRPLDPVTFVAVPLLLFTVALVASWLPARRAASVQASIALRTE